MTSGPLRLAALTAALFAALLLALSPLADAAFAKGKAYRDAAKAGPAVKKTSRSGKSADKRVVKRQKAKIRKDRPAKPLFASKKVIAVKKSGNKGARFVKRPTGGASVAARQREKAVSKARPGPKDANASIRATGKHSSRSTSARMTAASKWTTNAASAKARRTVSRAKDSGGRIASAKTRESARIAVKSKRASPGKAVSVSSSKANHKVARTARGSKRPPAPLVLIDPGHGGHDPGAMASGLAEKNVTLSVARHLAKRLVKAGFRVKLTRSSDRAVTPLARLRMASRLKPALFVSLHCNSAPSSRERGLETFAYLPKRRHEGRGSVVPMEEVAVRSDSSVQAKSIHDRLTRAVRNRGVADNGVRLGRFAVLSPKPWPSILIEMGYLTNKYDAKRLASKKFRAWFAGRLAYVLADHLKQRGTLLASAKDDAEERGGRRTSVKASPAS